MSQAEGDHPGRNGAIAWLAVMLSTVVFFTRLYLQVLRDSVDVVFWDQWDYLMPFFREAGPWAAFRSQLGPHRQGIGSFVIAASNALSGWNMQVIALVTTTLLLAAMLVALRLKVVLYGNLTVWDALIPPLFFRMSQYLAIASIPNPSHGAIPLILIGLAGLILTIESRTWQAAALIPLAFISMHTGFANLLCPILVGVLLLRGVAEFTGGRKKVASGTAATVVGIVLVSSIFFVGLETAGVSIPCVGTPEPGVIDYVTWSVNQIGHFWGIPDESTTGLPVGAALFLAPPIIALAILIRNSWASMMARASMLDSARFVVPPILISYSLAFSVGSAKGRICHAATDALASRYVTHMVPLALGLYFLWVMLLQNGGAETRPSRILRAIVGTILVVLTIWGGTYYSSASRVDLALTRLRSLQWAACVRGGDTSAACSDRLHFMPYTVPGLIEDRVDYLRTRHLSFFRD